MHDANNTSFEAIFRQNERRIHYHMHKLGIHDSQREFYVEGIYAMWMAYKKYEPDKGPMATYFNYTIRNRLIDMLRKKTTEDRHQQEMIHEAICTIDNGNRSGQWKHPLVDPSGVMLTDDAFWKRVQSKLTDKQWKWVQGYIIEGMPLGEIARQEGVSVEAVKSWGRGARRKLKDEGDVLARLYQ
ncbi:hypothetical protein GCM10007063_25910 [Lentibacillus kapialis]|uniref:Sigma-70 family RNA polymerase sigma factor n=1 Tax=Lentibacillus kapialis TaxID=340214 RepID=A0A917UZU4_9BACI|nr:sigma-70 family RNA polymerase sigma factor [Lentibacillus kapialis]GGK02412.1 hypothetical protein GCM10007063_25910 [Lentibacillus kapialis]